MYSTNHTAVACKRSSTHTHTHTHTFGPSLNGSETTRTFVFSIASLSSYDLHSFQFFVSISPLLETIVETTYLNNYQRNFLVIPPTHFFYYKILFILSHTINFINYKFYHTINFINSKIIAINFLST